MLFHPASLDPNAIRVACQKYGVLCYSRPEFHSKGVTLFSYFDLRSAINAKSCIADDLGGEASNVSAHYGVMLQASNNMDESRLIIRHLPQDYSESAIQEIFSRYGPMRSIQRTFTDASSRIENSCDEFIMEYFDIQDARLAASELGATSSTFWAEDTEVVFASLESRQQKSCKQLLAILARWRGELSHNAPLSGSFHHSMSMMDSQRYMQSVPQGHGGYQYHIQYQGGYGSQRQPIAMMIPQTGGTFNGGAFMGYTTPQGTYGYGQHQHIVPIFPNIVGGLPMGDETGMIQHMRWPQAPQKRYMQHQMVQMNGHSHPPIAVERPTHHGPQQGNSTKRVQRDPQGNQGVFSLDVDAILSGVEKRTTLMIRNIPNKYTQASVREEINVNHSGLYDFFYLPIDFKNRCNVGYAFINFIEATDVAAFAKEFSGSRWKNFNSEKICAVTFARIQGKSAMIARFQNSSLLEKDDEYRPLLFFSSGANKGQPESFPMGTRMSRKKEKDIGSHVN